MIREQKAFNATVAGQKQMFSNAMYAGTMLGMRDMITGLEQDREVLFQAWRQGGETRELWEAVATQDAVILRQLDILVDIEGGSLITD